MAPRPPPTPTAAGDPSRIAHEHIAPPLAKHLGSGRGGPPRSTTHFADRSLRSASHLFSPSHPQESVQTFGRKKTAVAVSYCKKGRGLIKINGCPIELVEPEVLRYKVFEPILLLGRERFANMDIRIRVKGGGYTSQIYAIRQAIAKSVVAYYQKCAPRLERPPLSSTSPRPLSPSPLTLLLSSSSADVDEASKKEIKDILQTYDRTLLVADPRRCEPKKFGGPGARARRQKSYR